MPSTLVVSANGHRARIFMQPGASDTLEEVHDVTGGGADAEPECRERLARCVAGFLRQAHEAEAFERLIVVGSEAFRRELRGRLAPPLDAAIEIEIDGDYTRFGAEQLFARIASHEARP